MTTFADCPHTALVVIDMQNAVIANAHRRDDVLRVVGTLVERARDACVPVLWVRHTDDELQAGSEAWRFAGEICPAPAEAIIEKRYRDAFDDTALGDVLSTLAVGRLIVVGAQTDMCIRSTLHGAIVRGYDALLVADAHTTDDRTQAGGPCAADVIRHTNLYWQHQRAPGRSGGVVDSGDLEFSAGCRSSHSPV